MDCPYKAGNIILLPGRGAAKRRQILLIEDAKYVSLSDDTLTVDVRTCERYVSFVGLISMEGGFEPVIDTVVCQEGRFKVVDNEQDRRNT